MARSTAIQRHAITAPVFGRGKLHRHRLVEILQANLDKRLILVVAPAGYGKTMLLADLTAHVDQPVCWVRLTEHDRDAGRLVRVVFDSIAGRFRRLRQHLDLRGMEAVPPSNLGRLMGTAIAEAGVPPFVVAFDDIHYLASSKDATALLAGLVDGLPRDVCCILAGREPLDLPLAKVAAANEVLAVGAGDMALAGDELEELLKIDGSGEASAEVRDRLMSESRGWIAGIQLLRMRGLEALKGSLPSPKDLTFEYFGAEVLGKQSEAMRRFAIESSVLPVMTAEAVEAVVRVKDGARWLREAVRRGLFITATGSSPRTYEYHPLFREYLSRGLLSDPSRSRQLKRRAARFSFGHGQVELAFELYIEAGAPKKAKRVAESVARLMRIQGRLETLVRWDHMLDANGEVSARLLLRISHLYSDLRRHGAAVAAWKKGVKAAVRAKDSWAIVNLRLQEGLLALIAGDPQKTMKLARRCLERRGGMPLTRQDKVDALGLLASASVAGRGDLREAAKYSRKAVGLNKSEEPHRRALSLSNHWAVLAWAGMKEEARQVRAQFLSLPQDALGPLFRLLSSNSIATDEATEGNISEALGILRGAIDRARGAGIPGMEGLLLITMADLYSDTGRPGESLAIYARASELLHPIGDACWLRYAQYRKSVALRRHGDHSKAKRVLTMPLETRRRAASAWVREIEVERLMQERRESYEFRLRRFAQLLKRDFSGLRAIMIEMHMAQILAEVGRNDEASELLLKALVRGDSSGLLGVLAGEVASSPELAALGREQFPHDGRWQRVRDVLLVGQGLPGPEVVRSEGESVQAGLTIRALGTLSITVSGASIYLKPKEAEILLMLADRVQVPRAELVAMFWGHLERAKQGANLHSSLYSIRRKVGDSTLFNSGGYIRLSVSSGIEYDVAEFLRDSSMARAGSLTQRGRLQALKRAAGSFGGPFAPPMTSNWAIARRSEVQDEFAALAIELGNAALVERRPEIALPDLRRALQWQPHRRDLALLLRRCLKEDGREAEALSIAVKASGMADSELALQEDAGLTILAVSPAR